MRNEVLFLFPQDIFDVLAKVITSKQTRVKHALVDSFTLYMALQMTKVYNGLYGERVLKMDKLRPIFSKSLDPRKDKHIDYFLAVLKEADLISYWKDEKGYIRFTIQKPQNEELIIVERCSHRLYKEYTSNVPFAIYCILFSIQGCYSSYKSDSLHPVQISRREIARRLRIGLSTANLNTQLLVSEGFIKEDRQMTPRSCNSYMVRSYMVKVYEARNKMRKREKYTIRKAKSYGFVVEKSRNREKSYINQLGYRIIRDDYEKRVVSGSRYELSIADVEDFLRRYEEKHK